MQEKKSKDMLKYIRVFLTPHIGPPGQTWRAGLFLRRAVVVKG